MVSSCHIVLVRLLRSTVLSSSFAAWNLFFIRSHFLGSLRLFFVYFGKAAMSDADIDSMLAFEENLHNLPLSQEVHYGSCDQEDLEAFFAEAPATPPLIGGSTSSVSPSSTTATSGSTPEQPISVVSRKRLRTKTTVPNYVPVPQSIQATGMDSDFGTKLSLNVKRHLFDCLRHMHCFYMEAVWHPSKL